MKKIVNGKLYDVDTAERIHEWDNGYQCNDAHYVSKDLYRTQKGNWFIVVFGGPLSEFGNKCGNNYHSDQYIQALDASDVVEWLEKHDGTNAILKHFPDLVQEA